MKKKLFIMGGYLLTIALLFGYLSYSAYRIKIEATVIMPQTYAMRAEYVLVETQNVYVNPGSEEYPISVTVGNDSCDLDLAYYLEVETHGRLPLSFHTTDGAIATVGRTPCLTTSAIFLNEEGGPAIFYLSGGALNYNQHTIMVSWSDAIDAGNELCREVDKLTIRARIWALPKYNEFKPEITRQTFDFFPNI